MLNNHFRIGLVNFLNSYPFRYGLENNQIDFTTAVPSVVAQGLSDDSLDIGLVPLAAFQDNPNWQRISHLGIASSKKVKTVLLFANKPINDIVYVRSDSDSMTSNRLCHVVFNSFFKREIVWNHPEKADAVMKIGDKAFFADSQFPLVYDLAEIWQKNTGLPFVFAVWAANKVLDTTFLKSFNLALQYGIDNIDLSVKKYNDLITIQKSEAIDYLQNNIKYQLDDNCVQSMMLFNELSKLLIK